MPMLSESETEQAESDECFVRLDNPLPHQSERLPTNCLSQTYQNYQRFADYISLSSTIKNRVIDRKMVDGRGKETA
jgi:hypothetical protein